MLSEHVKAMNYVLRRGSSPPEPIVTIRHVVITGLERIQGGESLNRTRAK